MNPQRQPDYATLSAPIMKRSVCDSRDPVTRFAAEDWHRDQVKRPPRGFGLRTTSLKVRTPDRHELRVIEIFEGANVCAALAGAKAQPPAKA
ncbi:MAG TPA: hypothetical protein VGI47_06605 [Candidatus Binataceae bacterium]